MYTVNQGCMSRSTYYQLVYGRHVARRHHRRKPHAPAIHSASHVDHEKRSCMGFYFYACMWFCSYSYGALLQATGAPLLTRLTVLLTLIFLPFLMDFSKTLSTICKKSLFPCYFNGSHVNISFLYKEVQLHSSLNWS